jgi:hypothetical protein
MRQAAPLDFAECDMIRFTVGFFDSLLHQESIEAVSGALMHIVRRDSHSEAKRVFTGF